MWQQWTNAVLGLAVLATPFLGLQGDEMTWTLALLGLAIAALAVWSATQEQPWHEVRHGVP